MNKVTKILLIIFTSVLTILQVVVLSDSIAEVYGTGWFLEATPYYILTIVLGVVFMGYTVVILLFAFNEKRTFQSVIASIAVGTTAIYLLGALLYGNPYFFMSITAFLLAGLFLYERNKTMNNFYIIVLIGFGFLFIGNIFGFITEAYVFFDSVIAIGYILLLIGHSVLYKSSEIVIEVEEDILKQEEKKYTPSYCGHCGTKIDEELVGCPGCGKNPQTSHHHCQTCGASLETGQVMCVQCHDSIRDQRIARFQVEETKTKEKRINVDGVLLGAYLLPIIGVISIFINLTDRPKLSKKIALYTGISIGCWAVLLMAFLIDLIVTISS